MRDSRRLMMLAAGIGAVAGLRSMTAPAAVTWATHERWISSPGRRFRFLKRNSAASVVTALALGELIADKLPFTPNRTAPPGLAARILSGAACAAALSASYGSGKKFVASTAVVGGLAAVAGAFIGMTARQKLRQQLHVSDTVIAVAEDGVAIGSGLLLARSAA
jgi:uncharacterized membrane protein